MNNVLNKEVSSSLLKENQKNLRLNDSSEPSQPMKVVTESRILSLLEVIIELKTSQARFQEHLQQKRNQLEKKCKVDVRPYFWYTTQPIIERKTRCNHNVI